MLLGAPIYQMRQSLLSCLLSGSGVRVKARGKVVPTPTIPTKHFATHANVGDHRATLATLSSPGNSAAGHDACDAHSRGLVSSYTSVMAMPSAVQQHEWMLQWRSAAVELERVRLHELATVDLARVAADLEDSCVLSALTARDSQGSGLTEQQRWLHSRPQA